MKKRILLPILVLLLFCASSNIKADGNFVFCSLQYKGGSSSDASVKYTPSEFSAPYDLRVPVISVKKDLALILDEFGKRGWKLDGNNSSGDVLNFELNKKDIWSYAYCTIDLEDKSSYPSIKYGSNQYKVSHYSRQSSVNFRGGLNSVINELGRNGWMFVGQNNNLAIFIYVLDNLQGEQTKEVTSSSYLHCTINTNSTSYYESPDYGSAKYEIPYDSQISSVDVEKGTIHILNEFGQKGWEFVSSHNGIFSFRLNKKKNSSYIYCTLKYKNSSSFPSPDYGSMKYDIPESAQVGSVSIGRWKSDIVQRFEEKGWSYVTELGDYYVFRLPK